MKNMLPQILLIAWTLSGTALGVWLSGPGWDDGKLGAGHPPLMIVGGCGIIACMLGTLIVVIRHNP